MQRTAVINVIGLSESLLGPHTPAINAFRQRGALATIEPAFPAVTCTAQSNYVTGRPPAAHGIVANGWYDRSLAEVQFWKQSNHLVTAPKIWDDLRAIDAIVGGLLAFYAKRGVQVVLLSEYGISAVNQPIHLNRLFRQRGWITAKEELGLELLDAGNSKAFAVADHQVAHVYVNDRSILNDVRALLERTDGVAHVMGDAEKAAAGVAHGRAGDLIAVARDHAWFTYYYWLDDARAPDFARCVDIHRKPGYDPVELFLDPKIPAVKLKILWRLLRKKLGFRMLMDVIPLDATLVKGSHGAKPANRAEWPLVIAENAALLRAGMNSTDVYSVIKNAVLAKP